MNLGVRVAYALRDGGGGLESQGGHWAWRRTTLVRDGTKDEGGGRAGLVSVRRVCSE